MDKEEFMIQYGDQVREHFIDFLVDECDYPRYVAEESDDWWEEYRDEEYAIFVANNYLY